MPKLSGSSRGTAAKQRTVVRSMTRRHQVGAAGLLVAAGAGAAAGALAGARMISGPRRPWPDYRFSTFEVGVPSEDVTFAADDGTRLSGWWLDRPGSERVVIVSHGHRGNKSDMLGIGPGLWRAGNSVLLFDFRGNGDSDDGPQSLAHYEQADLRAAIEYAVARRPDAALVLVGFSMGASVSILVAADDPRVRGLVLDSPFADMHGVIANAVTRLRLPAVPLVWLTDRATRWRYGYGFHQVAPIEVIGRLAPRPILLMHGDQDRVIPLEHAHRLFAAAGEPKHLKVFEGADHCGGYFQERAAYIRLVADFVDGIRRA